MGLFSKDKETEGRFGAQITEQAYRLMGADPENVTEAELHQQMVDAKSFDEKPAGEAANKLNAEIADLKAKLKAAEDAKTAMETANGETETELGKLKAEKAGLEVKLQEAQDTLAAKVKETRELAAEVATLTAGKKPKGTDENDDDKQFDDAPAGGGRTVKAGFLDQMLEGKSAN